MEYPKAEVKVASLEEKSNEGANISNKYLVSGIPTTEYYFEIEGIIDSEEPK